jgi:UDP-N-acetylglucosamine--N-acetylmuramyl-(pentapeptide) pyrophosphoryl-undecaprenol N-acetylglucosamine transferase
VSAPNPMINEPRIHRWHMSLKILISGGGTGGHIFPAIAIANTIKEINPETEFLFVGANGKLEMEKVPSAGYKIIGLNITGIQRKLSLSNLAFPFKLVGSLLKARSIINSFKPDVVVGVGGFASGPVLRMATWMGVPSLIQEQNSFAGITNRWVASSVSKACVAYTGMEKFFPKESIVFTGNPVRKEMVQIEGKRQQALKKFGFNDSKPVLLIVGGSLGAMSINQALEQNVGQLLEAGVQVLWQTGKLFKVESARVKEKYFDPSLNIMEFIYEMDLAYAAADFVVSRAGAIAVSELSLIGKPTILVPFPFAAEDHQTKNAMSLLETNAALHIADGEVKSDLVNKVLELYKNETVINELSSNILKHGKPNAAMDIANQVIALAK